MAAPLLGAWARREVESAAKRGNGRWRRPASDVAASSRWQRTRGKAAEERCGSARRAAGTGRRGGRWAVGVAAHAGAGPEAAAAAVACCPSGSGFGVAAGSGLESRRERGLNQSGMASVRSLVTGLPGLYCWASLSC